MTVSEGFYKKIKQWMVDPKSEKVAYLPFQSNGNPYKANVFIVGAVPEPYLEIEKDDLLFYSHFLVNPVEYQELFSEDGGPISREYKGCLNFMEWMKKQFNETVVLSYLNSVNVESTKDFNELKKQESPIYKRGLELFKVMVNEFKPKVVIVQGAANWKQFLDQYGEQLIDLEGHEQSVQQLESHGVVAKLPLETGELVNVLACRSLSNFGKTGTTFGDLKGNLSELLQN